MGRSLSVPFSFHDVLIGLFLALAEFYRSIGDAPFSSNGGIGLLADQCLFLSDY